MIASRSAALALALLCAACATAIDDPGWVQAETAHFHLFSNLAPRRTIEIARRLEVFRELVRQTTNTRRFEERVPTYVFLFDGAGSFHAFSPGRNVVGYLNPTSHATYMALNASHSQVDALEVVQHEYTHFLQFNQTEFTYPPWYVEGLAEMLSTVRVTDTDVELGRAPNHRVDYLRLGIQNGYWHTVHRVMDTRSLANWPDIQIGMFYAEAWALIDFLHAGHLAGYPKRIERMQAYLGRLNKGSSHDAAYAATFDVTEAALERELLHYLSGGVPFLRLPRAPYDVGGEPEVRPLEADQRLLRLGDLALQFTFDERPDRAKARTAETAFRKAIEIKPELALARAGLALTLRAQGRPGGDDDLERALQLAPEDPLVCLYAAEYLLPVRGSEEPVDRERLVRARGLIAQGLKLAPDLSALHLALGRSYLVKGEDPAQAVRPLETSQKLLSWDMEGALALGEAYLRTSAREPARTVLTRVVNGTHDEKQRERANKLLAELGTAEAEDAE